MEIAAELKKELDKLEYASIKTLSFNILAHIISIDMVMKYSYAILDYKVIFQNVSSFYLVDEMGKDRFKIFDLDLDDYLECTSIGYYPNGIGKITIENPAEEWAAQWYSSANFAMEIWERALFIEAKSITINDITYDVGYPKLPEDN